MFLLIKLGNYAQMPEQLRRNIKCIKDSNGLNDGEAEGDPGSDSRRVRRGISVVPESS